MCIWYSDFFSAPRSLGWIIHFKWIWTTLYAFMYESTKYSWVNSCKIKSWENIDNWFINCDRIWSYQKTYRVFIKYCVFSLKFCDFLDSARPVLRQRWCSTCLVCVHTLTPRENQRKTRVRNIIKSLEKTQYLMNTL